ncbi:MAG: hypothetical protein DSZ05_04800 [Sulfurospirillum sp.]|nr:MAG: hypothetical protein DSZ05_04800 [Sulfurospirillum sp.]
MRLKAFWQTIPIAWKIFGATLLFLVIVEFIATLFVWQYESKALLANEHQNLTRELSDHRRRLISHLAALEKETRFLSTLEVMDDIVAKDIDKRILTLLEHKAADLGEEIILLVTDPDGKIIISPKAFLNLPVRAFHANYIDFEEAVFASFDKKKQLGTLYLLYPLENLQTLHTDNPHKHLWLQPPSPVPNFTLPHIGDVILVSQKLTRFLPGWRLNLAYDKKEALTTLKHIQKVQLYTLLLATLLFGIVILILSRKLTLPLVELLNSSEKALEAKSTFLSTMSHELRTPLGSILNLTQHLTLSKTTDTSSRKMLSGIETSAQHLLSMINNILQISKLEAKSIIVNKERVDLEEVMEEIYEITEPLILDKDLLMKKKTDLIQKEIVTDSNLLKQVMINLLSNAIKFTRKGSIEVTLTQSHKTYIFRVKDTGIGIDKERQKQLFTPFFQAHTHIDTLKNSSGLGLSLSQKTAQLLGGKVKIESAGIHRGTTATFYFKSI